MKKSLLFCLSLFFIQFLYGQDSDEPKFKAVPSGRVLIDGALYASPQKELFKDGMAIPEARLGVKMNYGKWTSWIDVGFAYGKIGLRNMWIEYAFNPNNFLRVGNCIQQFGLQSTSQSLKHTFEAPMASMPFTPGLQLGAMFTHLSPNFFLAGSFHVESSALTNIMNYPIFSQQGYGILSRLVWRKVKPESGATILQAGISGSFATPQRRLVDDMDVHDGFELSANFPTKVTTLQAVGATIPNSMNLFKFTPELLLARGRIALESQYFFQQINRRQNLTAYRAHSVYAMLRGIIFGQSYSYDANAAQLANPKKNTLECVLNYSYLDLSDRKSGFLGGIANSLTATFNYYFNPYITARLNYAYTHVWNRKGYDPVTLNTFQLRLMVLF